MEAGSSESYSVLVIEKDPIASHLFKKSLEEDKKNSYLVDLAVDVPEALNKLNQKKYHVLLLEADENEDALSTGLTGDLHGKDLQIPIVMMSSSRRSEITDQAKRMGVSKLIIKSESTYHDLAKILKESYRDFQKTRRKSDKPRPAARFRQPDRGLDVAVPPVDRKSFRDELTGLCNHSCIEDRILIEFAKASQHGYPVSCLMVDIDHFKGINEKFGHKAGDEILRECGEILFENCRLTDLVSRYGGEEFAVLLPHTAYAGAQDLADRLRNVFAEKVLTAGDQELQLTISVGISSYPADPVEDSSEITSFAGEALFRAKAMGRNCVVMYCDMVSSINDELPDLKISEEKVTQFQRRMSEIANVARRAYMDASRALIKTLEHKDPYTAGHAASCAKYALPLSQAMGLSLEDSEIVQHAALLHDIGKICIPDNILLKSSRLSFIEFEAMKQHPYLGYKILKPIRFLQQESILVLHHHEWFNGEGYPCRLKGNEIPVGARIISVIEAYDTMRTAGGRYKQTCAVKDSVAELISCAGTQFDPLVVKAFVQVLAARGELGADAYDKRRLDAAVAKVS